MKRGRQSTAASIRNFRQLWKFYSRLAIARIEDWAIGSGWQGAAGHFYPGSCLSGKLAAPLHV